MKRDLEKADVNNREWEKMAEDRERWRQVIERFEHNV